jgi:adenylate cyclase
MVSAPARILIVDDEPFNRDVLVQELELLDHEGVTAIHGREALDRLAGESVDLILLDIMMPEMDGFEVLRRLKDDARWRHIPVIMISALDDLDSVVRCIALGAEDHLPKPFDPVLLKARIGACLENKRWHDQEVAYLERIEREKAKHEALLRNILPEDIVTRLNGGEVVIADRVEEATILIADLVGFSAIAAQVTPAALMDNLKRIFSTFDALCQRFGIERIKTIGDAYMATAGLPEPRPDNAEADAEFAFDHARRARRGQCGRRGSLRHPHRHPHRHRDRRCDRAAPVPLRHLGRHGESCEQAGIPWHAWPDPRVGADQPHVAAQLRIPGA